MQGYNCKQWLWLNINACTPKTLRYTFTAGNCCIMVMFTNIYWCSYQGHNCWLCLLHHNMCISIYPKSGRKLVWTEFEKSLFCQFGSVLLNCIERWKQKASASLHNSTWNHFPFNPLVCSTPIMQLLTCYRDLLRLWFL